MNRLSGLVAALVAWRRAGRGLLLVLLALTAGCADLVGVPPVNHQRASVEDCRRGYVRIGPDSTLPELAKQFYPEMEFTVEGCA